VSEIAEAKPVTEWNLDHLFRCGPKMILHQHVRNTRLLALDWGCRYGCEGESPAAAKKRKKAWLVVNLFTIEQRFTEQCRIM
jgi:hypothetical protein